MSSCTYMGVSPGKARRMRVRICYGIDADNEYRRAIAHRDGDHGKRASRGRIKRLREAVGSSNDDDMMYEWRRCTEGCQPRPPALVDWGVPKS